MILKTQYYYKRLKGTDGLLTGACLILNKHQETFIEFLNRGKPYAAHNC